MPACIIFDLDGLLVDSESLQYKAYNQAFSSYGHPISLGEWMHWSKHSYSAKRWIQEKGLSLDPEIIRAEKKIMYDNLIFTDLLPKQGACELVQLLYNHYPLALASSSRRESIDACLQKFSLMDYFEVVQSGTELKQSKPHPDVYLTTAHQMLVHPSQCLVFENSISGLEAAKSAGMQCIICPDIYDDISSPEYNMADLIVSSLSEVTLDTIENIA